jgi:arylsulfatase A-like enzyme
MRDVYDEGTLQIDRAVAALLDGLAARGHADDTLLVFAADHGESIEEGNPPAVGHGGTVRNELVHVPLMFYAPSLTAATVPCVASSMDLFPTVLDAMGFDPMPDIDGSTMLVSCPDHEFSSMYSQNGGTEFLLAYSVESAQAQVIIDCRTGAYQAYDLTKDPLTTQSLDKDAVPDGAALTRALGARIDLALSRLPGLSCQH